MKTVTLLYETDAHHTHSSNRLLGVFSDTIKAREYLIKNIDDLTEDNIQELKEYNQTYGREYNQTYGREYNYITLTDVIDRGL